MFEQKITFDKFIRWAIIIAIIFFSIAVINHLSAVLLPFFIAWVLAYLLNPIVNFIQHRMHIKVRAASIIIALFAVIAILAIIVYLIIPPMIGQFSHFTKLALQYVHHATHIDSIPESITAWVKDNSHQIEKFLRSKDFTSMIKETMPSVFNVLNRTWNIAMSIGASCITLLYLFFILLDYDYLTTNWTRVFPKSARPFWQELAQDAGKALNSYVRGQCLIAAIMGVLFCIGFTIIDFPMAIGLGILIGILDLVPYLHTFALIPTAFLAGLKALDTGSNFWAIFLGAIAVFCIVQVIIDMVVTPKVMGKQMGLNPAVLLLSLSVWGALLGFIGLIIALPLTTLIMAYWQRYVTKDTKPEIEENSDEE